MKHPRSNFPVIVYIWYCRGWQAKTCEANQARICYSKAELEKAIKDAENHEYYWSLCPLG